MSIEKNIMEELKQQIIAVDRSLANRIFMGTNPEKHTALPYWVMLSLSDPTSTEITNRNNLRDVGVIISFYIKNRRYSDYLRSSELREKIIREIPRKNRPYWHNYTEGFSTYDIELDVDDDEQYEGFVLELEFSKIDEVTCPSAEPAFYVIDGGQANTIFEEIINGGAA